MEGLPETKIGTVEVDEEVALSEGQGVVEGCERRQGDSFVR